MKFVVRMSYNATIDVPVDAADEGDALQKAREVAENADIKQFSLFNENNASVVSRED